MIKRIALLTLLPFAALAHGDAEWIMRGGYLDNLGRICCNETDCARAVPGEISRIDGGWRHNPTGTVLRDGDPGIHRSIDADTWRCVRGGELKCVFTVTGS